MPFRGLASASTGGTGLIGEGLASRSVVARTAAISDREVTLDRAAARTNERSPSAICPFLQMRSLRTDRGVGGRDRQHDHATGSVNRLWSIDWISARAARLCPVTLPGPPETACRR